MPLTASMSGAASRRCIVARLGRLRALNGSEVRTREREDAERFYLRQVATEYPEGGLPADAVRDVSPPEGEAADESAAPTPAPAAPAVDEYGRSTAASGAVASRAARKAAPSVDEYAEITANLASRRGLLTDGGHFSSVGTAVPCLRRRRRRRKSRLRRRRRLRPGSRRGAPMSKLGGEVDTGIRRSRHGHSAKSTRAFSEVGEVD